ncbi:RagB/SusD family nutrient uptake outer membrane protein [Sphingobacterium deserti]|uniref:RagB/SusD domain-containing protein n=1 Tax=Sphingobacterium deserti TaxID=1229276 RepID=A0A0B8SZI6_9SPHI|nr:RagB/SusD family nutrient uptake outer membrane protein [Sphingobacterium deserti]KGE13227.1 RagB/SusD domain-containing protein [Sphingobacterium deserti]
MKFFSNRFNIYFWSFFFSALASFTACKKALEVEPYSYFTSSNFFADEDEAYMATLGVYEVMSSLDTYGWFIPLVFDAATDVAQMAPGADDYRNIGHYLGIGQNPTFYTVWSKLYSGIDRANVVIEKIPQMEQFNTGTLQEKNNLNRMLGEAKFLRGFYASELVRLWGDVPFKTKSSQTGDELRGSLVDRYAIYEQIMKDMQEAATVLPAELPKDERVNKWAAKAMLAKVALFAGGYSLRANGQMERPTDYKRYYELAKSLIDEVMAAQLYKLNPVYSQIFKNQSQHVFDPNENIFEIAFYNPAGQRGNASWVGHYNAPTTANGVYGSTNPRWRVMKPFYSSFKPGDLRRDFSIASYSINAQGNRVPLFTGRQDESWAPGKWSREYQTNSPLERAYTHINWVVMRYADLLLMRAEVENELNEGPNSLAYEAINQVRRRGFGVDNSGSQIAVQLTNAGTGYGAPTNVVFSVEGGGGSDASIAATTTVAATGAIGNIVLLNAGKGYTAAPTITIRSVNGNGNGATAVARLVPKPIVSSVELSAGLSKDAFFQAIVRERAWELCFEGMRRADLIRWNLLSTKIQETTAAVRAIRANYSYEAGVNFRASKHELWPFPSNETDVNRNIDRNNPGY